MPNNLTGQNISDTYQRLLQVEGNIVTNGTGSAVTASHALTASYAHTASYAVTASYAFSSSHEIIKEVSSSHADIADGLTGTPVIHVLNITASGDISASGATVTSLTGSFNHIITDGDTIEFREAGTTNKVGSLKFGTNGIAEFSNADNTGNANLKASTITAVTKFVSDGTAEFESNVTVSGDFSASGKLHTSQVFTDGMSSIIADGDSLVFGNDSSNISLRGSFINLGAAATHHVTASGNISASGYISASQFIGNFTGSLLGTSSFATTASYVETSQTASYILASNIDQPFTNITASGEISASSTGSFEYGFINKDLDVDGVLRVNRIEEYQVGSGIIVDSNGFIALDSQNGDIRFRDAGVNQLHFDLDGTAGAQVISPSVSGDDILFKSQGGSSVLTLKSEGNVIVHDSIAAPRITASVAISASVINGAGTGTTQLNVAGQITASGNISSSGEFIGKSAFITNITASSNISASGEILGTKGIFTSALPLVANTTGHQAFVINSDGNANNNPYMEFQQDGTRRAFIQFHDTDNTLKLTSEFGNLELRAAATAGSDSDTTYLTVKAGGTISASAHLTVGGHITASGDISASGDITGDNLIAKDGLFTNGTGVSKIEGILTLGSANVPAGGNNLLVTGTSTFTSHITASGTISASGNLVAPRYKLDNINFSVFDSDTNAIRLGDNTSNTVGVHIFGHVTASVNVSSSATITARNFQYPTTNNTTVGSSTGDIVTWGTATATTAGQIYYYNTSGAWTVADADALATAYSLIAVATDDNSSKGMLLRGVTTLHTITGTQDEGAPLYLKASADGHANIDAPSTSGHIVRIIGYCLDTNKRVWFDPDKTWVELS